MQSPSGPAVARRALAVEAAGGAYPGEADRAAARDGVRAEAEVGEDHALAPVAVPVVVAAELQAEEIVALVAHFEYDLAI